MKSVALVLFLSYLLLEESNFSIADSVENYQQQTKTQESDNQCNSYCFIVFKPFLDHLTELKQAANSSDELREKITTLELSNKDFQIQLSNAEGLDKNSKLLINFKDEQIKEISKQLKDKDEQIKEISKQLKDKDEQIREMNQQHEVKDDKIKNQSDLLKNKEETILNLQSQLAIGKIQIENKDNLIHIKEDQIKDKTDHIKKQEYFIQQKEQQIKEKDENINIKITQINDQSAENMKKAKQIYELTNQVTEKTYLLSTCSEFDQCPSEGPTGIYNMKMRGINAFKVPCNSTGWMTIQRRMDGSQDFNRNWVDYKNGFGDVKREFFIGLEKLHLMTEAQPYELYITLRDINGTSRYAKYDNFKVGSEMEGYELTTIGKYSGTAGDSLKYHEKSKFSTHDRDNDFHGGNCAKSHNGGWWFNKCAYSSLNGNYYKNGKKEGQGKYGIVWGDWKKFDYTISLIFVEMMIRPKSN
ncbi:fibrinogen-like protein 1 [Drosophila rhopaloa]|uniref:Fibrinogen C-terminal domain-containing protein n=1 Tax=Drosophila rhopaloa TaxID=1041015 RepID=A0ABM5HET2_DRORH|nr:fibrinogen-like protein 1 [Drosophila rhopaloa]